MAKRVVLAYSGGLDTSVAVRWLIENEGGEVIAVAVDVGQNADAGGADWDAIRERALAAGAIEATVVDARAGDGPGLLCPLPVANARYEGKYPLVSALSRPVIVRHLVAEARRHDARRRRPRLHRQGQRPGPLRGGYPCAGPRSRGPGPGSGVGPEPRELCRYAASVGHPASRSPRRSCTRSTRTSGAGPSSAGPSRIPGRQPPEDVYALTRSRPASRSRSSWASRPGPRLARWSSVRRRRAHRRDQPARRVPGSGGSTWWRTVGSASRAGRSTNARARWPC